MDQKDLINAAVRDLRSGLTILPPIDLQLRERVQKALNLLTGERIDAFAAREVLQGVERSLLEANAGSQTGQTDLLLQALRAADQKLTAGLGAGHYSEG